jgi:hypothetical protein
MELTEGLVKPYKTQHGSFTFIKHRAEGSLTHCHTLHGIDGRFGHTFIKTQHGSLTHSHTLQGIDGR